MASAAENLAPPEARPRRGLVQWVDRWIYVAVASLFVATALAGFVPSSLGKVAAVQAGLRPPFPLILHVHAALMGAWLLLLLAQSTLVATGRRRLHQTTGMLGLALAPAMVVAGVLLVPTIWDQAADATNALPAAMRGPTVEANRAAIGNILLAQIKMGIVFAVLVGASMAVRRRDSGLHKRLLFLATASLLPPAFARIAFLPTTMPHSYLSADLYTLLWIAPLFAWDLYRLGRVHRAYLIWLALYAPLALVVHGLWGNADWLALAPRLVGGG